MWNFTVLLVGTSVNQELASAFQILLDIEIYNHIYSSDLTEYLKQSLTDFTIDMDNEQKQSLINVLRSCTEKFKAFELVYSFFNSTQT